jgi:hypothetical protein
MERRNMASLVRIATATLVILGLPATSVAAQGGRDSAFRQMQERGRAAMGVDQYTSTHVFQDLPDGGRIELQRDVADSGGVATIRQHLQHITGAFAAGDFALPGLVHATDTVPGVRAMTERREAIRYAFRELPRGGEVRIITADPAALEAIHAFLAFQRHEHHAHDH